MNRKSNLTFKIGVTGFHKELIGKVNFFELDTIDPALNAASKLAKTFDFAIHMNANHFYFKPDSPTPLYDRVLSLVEMNENSGSEACILKLNPKFFEAHRLTEVVAPFKKIWDTHTKIKLWVDLPKALPPSLRSSLSFASDPFWHSRKKTKYWRIHGWHDQRWVRRYSEEHLKSLAKDCAKFKPDFLVFAHSQRTIQVLEFLKIRNTI